MTDPPMDHDDRDEPGPDHPRHLAGAAPTSEPPAGGAPAGDDGEDAGAPSGRRKRRGRRRRWVLRTLLALLVVLVAAGAVAGYWVQRQVNPPGGPGQVVEINIPEGATTDQIGRLLRAEGIIGNATVWRWYIRFLGGGPFQAGRYELRKNSSMGSVVSTLEEGPLAPPVARFTVPEGLTFEQTLARLADSERGLGLDPGRMERLLTDGMVRSRWFPDIQSFEGILFPETYEVPADADEEVVLRRMVGQLDRVLDELDVAAAQERFNLTPYEVLIAASLIESEAKVADERPMVARVIYNRLRQGIPLGIDATSCYEKGEIPCRLVSADFERDTPYNTRRNAGLPPTPISAPGRTAIAAALEPADGPWIYYVLADADGTHFFTDSAAEFERAKAECRRQGLGCG